MKQNDPYAGKKRVLVISDEPIVLAEIKMELMEVFDVSMAATSDAVLEALETYGISLIVIYIGKNRENAFFAFADISEAVKRKGVPFMFLAGKGSDADELFALENGAVDYTVRRRGTLGALRSRIGLRIRAGETEKRDYRQGAIESGIYGHASAEPSNAEREGTQFKKTILIVDDMELNREIIAGMLLEEEGFTVDFAADGGEAVDKFSMSPERYALILMDVRMPVLDGMQATKEIRSLGCHGARTVPIIALTAGLDGEETAAYYDSGMNGYIIKPVEHDRLMDVIAEYCL